VSKYFGELCDCRNFITSLLLHTESQRNYNLDVYDTNKLCIISLDLIFNLHNSSGRTMALRLTKPLTEMSTRNTSWG